MINKKIEKIKKYIPVLQEAYTYHESLKLDWNELSDFPNNELKFFLIDSIKTTRFSWYAPVEQKQIKFLLSDFCNVNIENIILFNGSDYAHEVICRTYLNEKDDVLILNPNYDNFRLVAESICHKVFYYNYDMVSGLNIEDFNSYIMKIMPKIVYISRPNNPLGYCIDNSDVEFLIKSNSTTLFLIDEAYIEFSKKKSASSLINFHNIIVTRTFSKAFGIAGLKLGYSISNEKIASEIDYLRNSKCLNIFAIKSGEFLLKNKNLLAESVSQIIINKKNLYHFFEQLGFKSFLSEANFILLEFQDEKTANSLFQLLRKNKIYVRFYSINNIKKYLRITVPYLAENNIKIKKIIKSWKN